MKLTITIDDQLSPLLCSLGKDMPRVVNLIVASIAKAHKERAKENYLSGQALQVRTGALRDAIFYYKVKQGIWETRPIGKSFNWAHGFETGMTVGRGVHVPPHPWSKPALQDIAGGVADRIIEDIITRVVTKRLETYA